MAVDKVKVFPLFQVNERRTNKVVQGKTITQIFFYFLLSVLVFPPVFYTQCFTVLLSISLSWCVQVRRFLSSTVVLASGIEFLHLCPRSLSLGPLGDTLYLLRFTSLTLSTCNTSTSLSPFLPPLPPPFPLHHR